MGAATHLQAAPPTSPGTGGSRRSPATRVSRAVEESRRRRGGRGAREGLVRSGCGRAAPTRHQTARRPWSNRAACVAASSGWRRGGGGGGGEVRGARKRGVRRSAAPLPVRRAQDRAHLLQPLQPERLGQLDRLTVGERRGGGGTHDAARRPAQALRPRSLRAHGGRLGERGGHCEREECCGVKERTEHEGEVLSGARVRRSAVFGSWRQIYAT